MLNGLMPRFPLSDLRPAEDLCVIGDVHGCFDALTQALDRAQDRRVICVGDYIDRGPHSADVLRLLEQLDQVVCLAGNHEEMLLQFLDDPEAHGTWASHYGAETLASFGVAPANGRTPTDLRDELAAQMGEPQIAWLRALPNAYISGNVAVVHAGADPRVPMADQSPRVLRWGHGDFQRRARRDGVWVVHGHTIVPEARAKRGRIAVDTGAFATGRLTAAHISPGTLDFEVFRTG